jgi:diguanylate cyclase (GGDEF)-like protein
VPEALLRLFTAQRTMPVIATLAVAGAYHCCAARTALSGATARGLRAGLVADLVALGLLFYLTGGMLSPLLAFVSIWAIGGVMILRGIWRWLYATALAGAGIITTPSLRLLYSPVDPEDPGIVIGGAMAIGTATTLAAFGMRRVQRMRDQLVRASMHDPLTGLLNRRAFDNRLAKLCGSGAAPRPIFSVAIVDVDHFKSLNDTKGHEAGDRALTELARLISANLRPGDRAYRIGGEEFAIVFPATSSIQAQAAMYRLRDSVRAKTEGAITFSAGIASGTQPSIVALADQAMYAAKRAGRDNIQLNEAFRLDQPRRERANGNDDAVASNR